MKTWPMQLSLCWVLMTLSACTLSPTLQATPSSVAAITPVALPKIDRHPAPQNWHPGPIPSLPSYDPSADSPYQIDLRSANLTALNLTDRLGDLMHADFDTQTKWPSAERMPRDFDWKHILELGRDPGLGVRRLRELGHTGRGVSIAIIDQTLLLEHEEYADRVQFYEEINNPPDSASAMHGAAVASIAVGKTVGVAPEANLFYIGTFPMELSKANARDLSLIDFRYIAQSIRRLLAINRQLSQDQKIRVIAIQMGWSSSQMGYDEVTAATNEAKAAGMFVISSSVEQTHGYKINGLGRDPLADPDRFESYDLGLFWAKAPDRLAPDRLLIPMDSRTVASFTGTSDYAFYRAGGWSWITPYLAGVYALAVQVDPDITPDRFWSLALKTGRTVQIQRGSENLALGPILDPVAIINALEHR